MPACKNCPSFDPVNNVCRIEQRDKPRSAVRNCVTQLCEQVLSTTKAKKVLEIGAGVWKFPRRTCAKYNIVWQAVDPRWKTDPKSGRFNGHASSIPFPENTFELVLAFETMEHWHEWGDNIPNALKEINRVLTPGGKLVITVPIYLHGAAAFVQGDIPTILANFDPKLWSKVETEEWRREHAPLAPHTGWLNNRARNTFIPLVEVGHKQQTVQTTPSSWSLNINAIK